MSDETEAAVRDARRRHEGRLMALRNVVGVGVGRREAHPVLKVYVTHKVPDDELRAEDRIPKDLDGVAIDVEEIGVVQAQS